MRLTRILLFLAVVSAVIAAAIYLFDADSRDGRESREESASSLAEQPPGPEVGAYLDGVVRDIDGQPIADAYILVVPVLSGASTQALSPEALLQWTGGASSLTDEQGYFAISGLAFDTPYYVAVQHEAYASTESGEFRLARGQSTAPLEITLETGSALSGTALLEDGSPARGQVVHLARLNQQESAMELVQMARTNDEGHFAFGHVPAGAYRLGDKLDIANPESTEKNVLDITADGRTTLPNLNLCISQAAIQSRSGVIHGVVVGPDGQPVDQAVLTVSGEAARAAQTVSAADGTFVLDNIPEGVYTLKGRAESGVATVEGVATGTTVTLTLRTMPTVSGIVLDSSGAAVPLCAVRLTLVQTDEEKNDIAGAFLQTLDDIFDSSDAYVAVSDTSGLFTLLNVEPGTYVARATSPLKGTGTSESLTVSEGDDVPRLTVRLNPNAVPAPFSPSTDSASPVP